MRKGKIYPSECRVPKNSRDVKASLSDQFKEIEENNRMGKTRVFFKKIRDNKCVQFSSVTFHSKMDTRKNRNVMHLKEAEDIKKR